MEGKPASNPLFWCTCGKFSCPANAAINVSCSLFGGMGENFITLAKTAQKSHNLLIVNDFLWINKGKFELEGKKVWILGSKIATFSTTTIRVDRQIAVFN